MKNILNKLNCKYMLIGLSLFLLLIMSPIVIYGGGVDFVGVDVVGGGEIISDGW